MDCLYIGLDSSTTATKAVAWTREGEAIAEGRAALRTDAVAPGLAEQDAVDWWRSSVEALKGCLARVDPGAIAGIGLTVQRETFALLDERSSPLAPAILWYDARGAEELPGLRERLGERTYLETTGKQLDVTSAVCKLTALRRAGPRTLRRAARFTDVLAYLALRLTGRFATTWSGVDTTGLVHLTQRDWYEPHLRAAGLERVQMPELLPPCSVIGAVTAEAAAATGLRKGTPVVAGGGDGHCFALAASRLDPTVATVTLGTSAVLGFSVNRPAIGDYFRTLLSCREGDFLLESVIQCGSATVAWLHDHFAPAAAGGAGDLEEACGALPPGADGLLVLPYWRGVRVPHNDPRARGLALGWTERHTLDHFQRAIMEGIAMEMALLTDRISGAVDLSIDRLVLGGGGASSPTWCRIFANVFNRPVRRAATVETASLGAALCAVSAVEAEPLSRVLTRLDSPAEIAAPDQTAVAAYAELIPLYAQLYDRTRDLSHHLSDFTS